MGNDPKYTPVDLSKIERRKQEIRDQRGTAKNINDRSYKSYKEMIGRGIFTKNEDE